MKKINNEQYLSRPKSKPDESLKGKMNKWNNGYAEFIPQGSKESQRQELKRLGDSSFYKTSGKKDSSFSLHLNVDGESQDPVAEMLDLFLHLTEDQRKQLPELPQGLKGRMLFDDGKGLKVWLDTEKHKVSILTELECAHDIERQLLQAQAQMNVTIARHRSELIKNNSNNK